MLSEPVWGLEGESSHSLRGLHTATVTSFRLKGTGRGKHSLGRYYRATGLCAPLKERRVHPETGSREAYLPGTR